MPINRPPTVTIRDYGDYDDYGARIYEELRYEKRKEPDMSMTRADFEEIAGVLNKCRKHARYGSQKELWTLIVQEFIGFLANTKSNFQPNRFTEFCGSVDMEDGMDDERMRQANPQQVWYQGAVGVPSPLRPRPAPARRFAPMDDPVWLEEGAPVEAVQPAPMMPPPPPNQAVPAPQPMTATEVNRRTGWRSITGMPTSQQIRETMERIAAAAPNEEARIRQAYQHLQALGNASANEALQAYNAADAAASIPVEDLPNLDDIMEEDDAAEE